jgi:hypothetical protein
MGGKVGVPQIITDVEYCAMESLGGKIPFMICSGALIPWALFHPLFLLLDFYFIDFYGMPWLPMFQNCFQVFPSRAAVHCMQ